MQGIQHGPGRGVAADLKGEGDGAAHDGAAVLQRDGVAEIQCIVRAGENGVQLHQQPLGIVIVRQGLGIGIGQHRFQLGLHAVELGELGGALDHGVLLGGGFGLEIGDVVVDGGEDELPVAHGDEHDGQDHQQDLFAVGKDVFHWAASLSAALRRVTVMEKSTLSPGLTLGVAARVRVAALTAGWS